MSNYRGRFAPSPTGPLHFGSLVAAVGSYLDARANDGTWLVRIEDLDPPREVAGAARDQLDTLAAFGMVSDEPVVYQSQRAGAYSEALDALRERGAVFDCGCSRRDIPDDGIYPGTCRNGLPDGCRARSVRVRVPPGVLSLEDAVQGHFAQDLTTEVGDFVVRRADGLTAYQLAVVVDDAWQGITTVVRGADLLGSTPRQMLLQRLLDLRHPRYAHLPVAFDETGGKLSKQLRSRPVDAGNPVAALSAALTFLGLRPPATVARGSAGALWRFARAEWSLERVPRLYGTTPTGPGG